MKSISTQTGGELAATDPVSQESPPANIKSCPNIKPDGAKDCTSENSQRAQSSVSPSVTDIQAKAKMETTFGVNNDVTFDEKSGVKPKVRSEPKESPSVKCPENVEQDSENLCHKESLVKVFTAEKDDLSPPDNRNKKKENKNLSPSAKCPIKKSSPRSGMNRQQQETQIDAGNKNSTKICTSTVRVDRDSRSEKAPKDNTDLSINNTEVVQDITEDIDGHLKNGIDNAAVSKRAGPKTGARPKHTMTTKLGTDNCKDSESNNVCESGNTKPKSDMVKMIDKAEPMEVAYSFDYDENDRNDDQFLSQSLNKISFNTKKESREELRKSFPPDPQVARPALKPRTEVTQRLQKSKQRSPHQDAVAKFVARRRTGSPHIPKTVSSQNLQMVLNKVEFPKTLSSPALSEISAKGDCNSMVSNGFLSRNGADKPVCMKFV